MRVLLITSRYPLPPWRGNQVRTIEWLQALSDHEVYLLCPWPDESRSDQLSAKIGHYRASLPSKGVGFLRALAAGEPLQEGLFDAGSARSAVNEVVSTWRPDVTVVQMVRCGWAAEVIRAAAPSLPMIFDAIDAMGLHFQRAADTVPTMLRFGYRIEARRCRRRERRLVSLARVTTAVARRDLAALGASEERGLIVPVSGREVARKTTPTGSQTVLLSGNLGYRPTVRGALWFARHVWPKIHQRFPEARWVVAGARPAKSVRRLATLPGVEIHADVDDLASFLSLATVAIAPMSSGSGVPMKVLEAMAGGIPVVADPWAADGLDDPMAVAAAATVDEWIASLGQLLGDQSAARDLGDRGHALWQKRYRAQRIAEDIRSAVAMATEWPH
jgi:glycosyltransferase involved in cell wall biosynthesis